MRIGLCVWGVSPEVGECSLIYIKLHYIQDDFYMTEIIFIKLSGFIELKTREGENLSPLVTWGAAIVKVWHKQS